MLNAIIELKAIKVLYKALGSICECNQALVVDIDTIQKITGRPRTTKTFVSLHYRQVQTPDQLFGHWTGQVE